MYGSRITDRFENINFDRLRTERLEKARAKLVEYGLGSVLCFSAANIRYLTGWSVVPFSLAEAYTWVLLPRTGDPVLWVTGRLGEIANKEMPWMKGKVRGRRVSLPAWDLETFGKSTGGWEKEVADVLYEAGVKDEPCGLDFHLYPFFIMDGLKKAGVKLVDGNKAMLEARKIKTRDEVELMRIACANAEAAFADVRDAIRPGVTERELSAIATHKLMTMGNDLVIPPFCVSGHNTLPNRTHTSDKPIRPGDMIFMDTAGTGFCGYVTCIYRCFTCGRATTEQKESYARSIETLHAGMSAVKAGNTTLDICNKWPSPEHWGKKDWNEVWHYATGHGLGLELHEIPMIMRPMAEAKPIKLEEGMVLALETYEIVGEREGGGRPEEEMVVTKDGHELLTRFPVEEITECWI